MNWKEKRQDIIDRLKQFKSIGTVFLYHKGQYPSVDKDGNNDYNPPSIKDISSDLGDLYYKSAKDNFRWEFCNLQVYKNTLDEEFQKYKDRLPEADKSDFIQEEIKVIQRQGLYFQDHKLINIFDDEAYPHIKLSQNKKLKFLELCLNVETNKIKQNIFDNSNDSSELSASMKDKGWENVFTEDTWQLFRYLEKNYTASDTALRAKYSWLYHFLKDDGIICKQDVYIDFIINTERLESFSKIQQTSLNSTYSDRAKPNLTSLAYRFHSQKRFEIN